jgi:hypothetical protein
MPPPLQISQPLRGGEHKETVFDLSTCLSISPTSLLRQCHQLSAQLTGRPYIGWTDRSRSRAASSMAMRRGVLSPCNPAGRYLVEYAIPSATQQCHLPQRPQDVAYMWQQTAGTLPKAARCTICESARCDVICEELIHQRADPSLARRKSAVRVCVAIPQLHIR